MTNLEQVLKDIKHLEDAKKLLFKIWDEVDPYQRGQISAETWREVRSFFEFDDSE